MMVPMPVQAAAVAAWSDDEHVRVQRERYARRRQILRDSLQGAGFRIDQSAAGLYLWATRDEPCWDTVNGLADRGILVAPGDFYGPGGDRHVRVALTASDDAVERAAQRLA
jgi:aspartate/methionine/tyrosine aminotransferase